LAQYRTGKEQYKCAAVPDSEYGNHEEIQEETRRRSS
jgi:hypothetical protein